MNTFLLNADEWEDFSDLLVRLEAMFDIKFQDEELLNLGSFDDLISLTINKIGLENEDSCTTQRAFYQIRGAISELGEFEADKLSPKTRLEDVFPKKGRRKVIKKFESKLGVKTNMLDVNGSIASVLIFIFVISFVLLFINFKFGVLGILLDVVGWKIAFKFAKEIRINSIRELTEQVVCENYMFFRKDKSTINKTELSRLITRWFADNMGLEEKQIRLIQFK